MNRKSSLSKKITKYSALSMSIIGLSEANGQIIYTNVNPEEMVDLNLATRTVDFDVDGTDDFIFSRSYSSSSSSFYTEFRFKNLASNAAINNQNIILSGVAIDSNWSSVGNTTSDNVPTFIDTNLIYRSFTNTIERDEYCGNEGFLGFKIQKNGNDHFGWVKVELDCAADVLILKEYAVHCDPDEPINTGQTSNMDGTVDNFYLCDEPLSTIEENLNNSKLTYALNGQNLVLQSEVKINEVEIYNTLGQLVLKSEEMNNNISLNDLELGAYIVNAKTDLGTESFKIILK